MVRAAVGGDDLVRLGSKLLEGEERVVVDAARREQVCDRVANSAGATGIGVCSGVNRWISNIRRRGDADRNLAAIRRRHCWHSACP